LEGLCLGDYKGDFFMGDILATSNFSKYIPLDLTGFKGIFACEIKQYANVLKMDVILYQVRSTAMFDQIAIGLNKNPEAKNLVNTLDKEIVFQRSISQMDAINIKHGFQTQLNAYSNQNTTNVQMGNYVTLHGIIPDLNNLYLQYEHAYIIYSFFKFFIDSYDIIRLSFRHFDGVEDDPETIEEQVESQVAETDSSSNSNSETGEDDNATGGIFLEMMGVVGSQAIRTFIVRHIFNKKWNLDTAVSITDKESKILIRHHPLYDFNIWQYSSIHNNELVNILKSIKETDSFELANKLKQVTKQLIYVVFNRELLKKQDKSKYIFTVVTGLFLLYVYSLKMMESKFVDSVYTASSRNGTNYTTIVNYAFKYVLEKFNVNSSTVVKTIEIEYSSTDDDDVNFDPISEKLDDIFEQYKYLASIDQEEFMGSVFSKLSSSVSNPSKIDASSVSGDLELSLGKPQIISIPTFIKEKTFVKNELGVESIFQNFSKSFLDYTNIPLTELFKNNKIISYEYCQILFIQYNGINRKLMELPSYTSPVIRRYASAIIDGMFKEIDSNRFLANNTVSAFQMYRHFIAPFIKNEAVSDYASTILLYGVVVPHIVDVYNIDKMVDNFH